MGKDFIKNRSKKTDKGQNSPTNPQIYSADPNEQNLDNLELEIDPIFDPVTNLLLQAKKGNEE